MKPAKTSDKTFLLRKTPYDYSNRPRSFRIVDIFCGCGGMSLGISEAARRCGYGIEVALAMDVDETAVEVFSSNFPRPNIVFETVESWFDGTLGAAPTNTEKKIKRRLRKIDILLGGPPCQGHSHLNNKTRLNDKRNLLYAKMARAAEILKPLLVIIENVPSVLCDRGRVVDLTIRSLENQGYVVGSDCVDLWKTGVPQQRRRHFLIASRLKTIDPGSLLEEISHRKGKRDICWAINDLTENKSKDHFNSSSNASPDNQKRINWLFDNDQFDLPDKLRPSCHKNKHHTYRSV